MKVSLRSNILDPIKTLHILKSFSGGKHMEVSDKAGYGVRGLEESQKISVKSDNRIHVK